MKKYHYIDDQGTISDALPLTALQKIGLPPATKVLIEGGKQWITLADAVAGGSVVVHPPPPPVAAPAVAAKPPPSLQDMVAAPFKRGWADLNRPMVDVMLNRPESNLPSVKPAKQGLKGVLKGCLILVVGFPIFIGALIYLADRGVGGAKVSDAGAKASGGAVTSGVASPENSEWVKAENLPSGFDKIEVHITDSTVLAYLIISSKVVNHTGKIGAKTQESPTKLRMFVRMKADIDGVVVNSGLPVTLTFNQLANGQDSTLDYFIGGSSATESVLIKGIKRK